jgi:hypothetical protein
MVLFYDINVLNIYFPSLSPAATAQMDQLFRTFVPPYVNISLDRVVAYVPKPQDVKPVELNNTPPLIFVSYAPAILLGIDGQPVLADLPHTDLKSVVNTTWPLFQDKSNSQYYLLVNNIWLTAGELNGPWSRIMNVPRDFKKLPNSGKFAEVLTAIPPLKSPIRSSQQFSMLPVPPKSSFSMASPLTRPFPARNSRSPTTRTAHSSSTARRKRITTSLRGAGLALRASMARGPSLLSVFLPISRISH